jgi:hypothetical protein
MDIFLPPDIVIVEQIASGNNRILNLLYDKWRPDFINVIQTECSDKLKGKIDFVEIFHESVLVLYNYILSGRIFAEDGKIYCIDRYKEKKSLHANLKTYVINVGKNKLQEEIRRISRTIDIFERTYMTTDSTSPDYFDDYLAARVDTSKDGNDPDFLEWTRETNRDNVVTLVRDIMKKMTDPCKTLFNYIYFGDGGKRMSVKDIMKQMPDRYTNEASVRNQTSRCNKKFRETYLRLRNLL